MRSFKSPMASRNWEVGDLIEIFRPLVAVDADPPLDVGPMFWHAVHVATRREHAVAQEIAADYALECCAPTERIIEVRRGRKVETKRTLLPGYVLVRAPESMALGRSSFNAIAGVNAMLMAGDYLATVADAEVARLRAIEGIEPAAPAALAIGDMVRVLKGPFASFPGTVSQVLTRERIVVEVWVFGRATPVQFDDAEAIERI